MNAVPHSAAVPSETAVGFTLDGRAVSAQPGETIWQVARRVGVDIPHLCHREGLPRRQLPRLRGRGRGRAGAGRLLLSCAPTRHGGAHRQPSVPVAPSAVCSSCCRLMRRLATRSGTTANWRTGRQSCGADPARFEARGAMQLDAAAQQAPDLSHPAIAVHLDACIQCTRCLRACRDEPGQRRDGPVLARRPCPDHLRPGRSAGQQHLRRLRRMRAGLPHWGAWRRPMVAMPAVRAQVDSVCPFCGVGCQLNYHVSDGRITMSRARRARPTTAGSVSRAASASTTCTARTA
jgi:formate dehydrogenase major subunit